MIFPPKLKLWEVAREVPIVGVGYDREALAYVRGPKALEGFSCVSLVSVLDPHEEVTVLHNRRLSKIEQGPPHLRRRGGWSVDGRPCRVEVTGTVAGWQVNFITSTRTAVASLLWSLWHRNRGTSFGLASKTNCVRGSIYLHWSQLVRTHGTCVDQKTGTNSDRFADICRSWQ